MRLCLVEDDYLLGLSVRDAFKARGFEVDWVRDGESAEEAMAAHCYWAVVLDLGLPRQSGFDLLTGIRTRHDDTPVLIMAARDGTAQRIACLDAGADDYITKPFELDEMAARIRAVRRRRDGRASGMIQFGHLRVDPATSAVVYQGRSVLLPARELALLLALMEKPGRILSRTQLIEKIYGWDTEIESNAIEFHVHMIRRKLSKTIIRNIRGVGYAVFDETGGR
jgi:two-component system response regulator QseB